jgi:hypothetical protein
MRRNPTALASTPSMLGTVIAMAARKVENILQHTISTPKTLPMMSAHR